jgi:hypothetical protein
MSYTGFVIGDETLSTTRLAPTTVACWSITGRMIAANAAQEAQGWLGSHGGQFLRARPAVSLSIPFVPDKRFSLIDLALPK